MRPVQSELALGMSLALQSSAQEIAQVRSILREAAAGLLAEFGARHGRTGDGSPPAPGSVVALQFQDLADQLLASSARRIETVRAALGHAETADGQTASTPQMAAGELELF